MLTEQDAQDLMVKLIDLRNIAKETKDKSIISQMKKHEKKCIEQFKYLVSMKTGRYKAFSNYDDLNQEGFMALLTAMNNYNPKKGSFFWWAHKYIDTRISRSANLHTTIRYPLRVAKNETPHKETIMPTLIEERYCPDKELENSQSMRSLQSACSLLTDDQKQVINLVYGFDSDKPMSINKVCKKLNITRSQCVKIMNTAHSVMKDHIKL